VTITVLSESEYEAGEYHAVLVRARTVVCVDADDGRVRMVPLSGVSHVDAPEGSVVTGAELPEWFHGGGDYGFVLADRFPDLQEHLEDLEREAV
jgi:hypothetical protein